MRRILIILTITMATGCAVYSGENPVYEGEPPVRNTVTPQTALPEPPEPETENSEVYIEPEPRAHMYYTEPSAPPAETPPPTETPPPAEETPEVRELGTFHTEFAPDDEGRNENIRLAAAAINGKVVQPGGEFSFNGAVGPTIASRGYQLAVIYVHGQKSEGYGGGVCQVSSTLHNAAVNAGMEITERHDHSLPVTYVEAGKEAATSYGVLDFKFVNPLGFPVTIESHVAGGKIIVTLNTV